MFQTESVSAPTPFKPFLHSIVVLFYIWNIQHVFYEVITLSMKTVSFNIDLGLGNNLFRHAFGTYMCTVHCVIWNTIVKHESNIVIQWLKNITVVASTRIVVQYFCLAFNIKQMQDVQCGTVTCALWIHPQIHVLYLWCRGKRCVLFQLIPGGVKLAALRSRYEVPVVSRCGTKMAPCTQYSVDNKKRCNLKICCFNELWKWLTF